MKLLKINKPKILLVGAGNFGRHHLENLKNFHERGIIDFFGVVTKNPKHKKFAEFLDVQTFPVLKDELLKSVDAVSIVTPPSTHGKIAKKCLRFTNVFLEKPITLNIKEGLEIYNLAQKEKRILFLGHIYRFNSAIIKLKELISSSITKPFFIECLFGDYPKVVTKDCGILYSDLHGFDILDFLLDKTPKKIITFGSKTRKDSKYEDNATIALEYDSNLHSIVKVYWVGLPKTREISVHFSDKIIIVDLIKQIILIKTKNNVKKIKCFSKMPLTFELEHFVRVLKKQNINYPDAKLGLRILNIAIHAKKSLQKKQVINYIKI